MEGEHNLTGSLYKYIYFVVCLLKLLLLPVFNIEFQILKTVDVEVIHVGALLLLFDHQNKLFEVAEQWLANSFQQSKLVACHLLAPLSPLRHWQFQLQLLIALLQGLLNDESRPHYVLILFFRHVSQI